MIESYQQSSFFPGEDIGLAKQGGGLHIGTGFIIFTFLLAATAFFLYVAVGKTAAAVPAGLWALVVVIASPRAGIILILTLQIWDIVLNPEQETAYTGLSPVRVLSILCVLSYGRLLIGRRPRITSVRGVVLLLLIFLVWGFALISVAQAKTLAVFSIGKILIHVALLVVAVDLLSDRKTLQHTLVLTLLGGATGALYAMFGGVAIRSLAEQRLVLRGIGINAFANSLGLAILAGIVLIALRKSLMSFVLAAASGLAMLLASFRAGTRAVVIAIPLSLIAGLAAGYWRKVHKLLILGVIGALLFGGSLYWAMQTGFVSGDLQRRILGAFGGRAYETNVRAQLWKEAINIYLRQPQGAGPGNESITYSQYTTTTSLESHNAFLSVLVEYNIIGFMIFLAAFLTLSVAVVRIKDPDLRSGAVMILAYCALIGAATSIHETRFFWQPVMLIMVMVETDYRSRQQLPADYCYESESVYAESPDAEVAAY